MADEFITTYDQASPEAERYVRINVTRNSRGFSTDATVSVKTVGPPEMVEREIESLRNVAHSQITAEIKRQEGAEDGTK